MNSHDDQPRIPADTYRRMMESRYDDGAMPAAYYNILTGLVDESKKETIRRENRPFVRRKAA